MDQKLLREREAKCVQENPPGCTAGCPVHVDARGIIAAIRKGDYVTGFSLFHRIIPFPKIISRICDQPCQQACKRNEIDEAISINALEKICVDNNTKPPAKIIIPPTKDHSVAIIGAGLSGLTTALELARKGYKVVILEATNRLGGSIWDIPEINLPRQLICDDFSVFEKVPVEIRYNTSILSLTNLCEEFDSIYVGVGCKQNGVIELGLERDSDGRIVIDPVTLATSHPKVFAGGSLRQSGSQSPIFSVSDGKIAAISIDRSFQKASLSANREKEGALPSSLYTNIEGVIPEPRTVASDPNGGYSIEEASKEANRCLLCECLECVKVCEYLAHYRAYPKRYVREVYNNLSIVMGIHHANKMINTCSLCGLCEQVCPGKLNMGEICQEARQMMVEKGKMPPSAHDFALRDMQFCNGEEFILNRHQPGFTSSSIVFYPGCQLAASSPEYVMKMYNFLCEKLDGGVGIMLGCCGAPAAWAGQEHIFNETIRQTGANWGSLGTPKIITACPTCYRMFKDNFSEIDVENMWTLLERIGLPQNEGVAVAPQKLAIHDSCTTRHDAKLQDSIRNILSKLGHQIEELPLNRQHTTCCGYGGLMIYANREVAHKVINRRIKEGEPDYLAYCAMCRDNFASQGKRVYHLLDLIFGDSQDDLAVAEGPDYSQRQENRARLRTTLLYNVWGETVEERLALVKVIIPANVRQVMAERMILVDDVARVITHAESTGNKLQDARSHHFIAYYQPASVTYWVEYLPQDDGFVVYNAYCHRLTISG